MKNLLFSLIFLTNTYAQWFWQNPLPQGNFLISVSFSDNNIGTAVGYRGTVLRTIDGGQNWVIQASGTTNDLRGVTLTNANTGTVVGSGGIIRRKLDY